MQVVIQFAGLLQATDFADTNIASLLDIRGSQADGPVGIVKFLCTFARCPLRTKCRHETVDLVEAHAIATKVRTAAGSILDTATRNYFRNYRRKLANAEVLVIAAHVEGLVVH